MKNHFEAAPFQGGFQISEIGLALLFMAEMLLRGLNQKQNR